MLSCAKRARARNADPPHSTLLLYHLCNSDSGCFPYNNLAREGETARQLLCTLCEFWHWGSLVVEPDWSPRTTIASRNRSYGTRESALLLDNHNFLEVCLLRSALLLGWRITWVGHLSNIVELDCHSQGQVERDEWTTGWRDLFAANDISFHNQIVPDTWLSFVLSRHREMEQPACFPLAQQA